MATTPQLGTPLDVAVPDWSSERCIVIGVAGGSGSGKSTIAAKAAASDPAITVIKQDAYYRHLPSLTYEERSSVNYDHPDSIEFDLFVEHIDALKAHRAIDMPVYDFTTHLRSVETTRVEPTPVLIVEGILVLAEESVRERLDLRIFIDTDADLRLARRLQRDIDERGRTISLVLKQYMETVRPMYLEYVDPSKRHADLIIPGGFNPQAVALVRALIASRMQPQSL